MKTKKVFRRVAITFAIAGSFGCVVLAQPTIAAESSSSEIASARISGLDVSLATLPRIAALKASDLMLLGPAEGIELASDSFQVLGQTARLSGSSATLISLRRTLLRLNPGSVVAVRGRMTSAGEIEATSIVVGSKQNVDGAQPLFLRGIVRTVDGSIGKLTIGRLVVDYSGALHSLDPLSVRAGVEFVATGIRASADGSFIALSAVAQEIDNPDARGIGGSDLNAKGIGGSDLNAKGIGGSDLNAKGIGGSDLNAKGIGGSDLNAKGIGGSDLNAKGIGGSDLNAKGIGGSDLNAKGIGGSDLNAKGIGGSDLNAKGIGGSDPSAAGIGGSDPSAAGIGGSDPSAAGIGGSDPSAAGIGGSDPSAAGIGGSDPSAAGIGGSDPSAKGIGGSDPSAKGIGGSDF